MVRARSSARRRLQACLATVAVTLTMLPTSAKADLGVSSFVVSGMGSLLHFYFSAPQAFLPFEADGGGFESFGSMQSSPHAFGYAGVFPVPIATSVGIIVPDNVPGTDVAVPENVREGIRSVDFTSMPNYCQADFPSSQEGGDESFCGGPAQTDEAFGWTGATMNGHVKATGDFEDPGKTSILSESRAQQFNVSGLQTTLFGATSHFKSFMNDEGVPVAEASARIAALNLLGSLVRIEQIESLAEVVNDGTEDGSAGKVSLSIVGASVAGIPVKITPEGVTVSEPVEGSSPEAATDTVNQALADAGGASVRIVPGSAIRREGNRLIAESSSLVVEYDSQTPTPMHVIQEYAMARVNVSSVAATGGPSRIAEDLLLPSGKETDSTSDGTGAEGEEFAAGGESDGSSVTPSADRGGLGEFASFEGAGELSGDFGSSAYGDFAPPLGNDYSPSTDVAETSADVTFGDTLDGSGMQASSQFGNQGLLNARNAALTSASPWIRGAYLLMGGLLVLCVVARVSLSKAPLFK